MQYIECFIFIAILYAIKFIKALIIIEYTHFDVINNSNIIYNISFKSILQ